MDFNSVPALSIVALYFPCAIYLQRYLFGNRINRKGLEGPELEGPEDFEKKYQNVPGAAGPAAGAAAASAAASAVCIYYVIIGGRFAPPYKYMIKCIQQKQQQLQQQLQQQPQQLQGHFGNFFENVQAHLA